MKKINEINRHVNNFIDGWGLCGPLDHYISKEDAICFALLEMGVSDETDMLDYLREGFYPTESWHSHNPDGWEFFLPSEERLAKEREHGPWAKFKFGPIEYGNFEGVPNPEVLEKLDRWFKISINFAKHVRWCCGQPIKTEDV